MLFVKNLFFALVFFIFTGSKSYLSYIYVLNLISNFYEISYTYEFLSLNFFLLMVSQVLSAFFSRSLYLANFKPLDFSIIFMLASEEAVLLVESKNCLLMAEGASSYLMKNYSDYFYCEWKYLLGLFSFKI